MNAKERKLRRRRNQGKYDTIIKGERTKVSGSVRQDYRAKATRNRSRGIRKEVNELTRTQQQQQLKQHLWHHQWLQAPATA